MSFKKRSISNVTDATEDDVLYENFVDGRGTECRDVVREGEY